MIQTTSLQHVPIISIARSKSKQKISTIGINSILIQMVDIFG